MNIVIIVGFLITISVHHTKVYVALYSKNCHDIGFVLQYFRAVLVIPDALDKNHIKELMNILLCKLGFSSAIIHQVKANSSTV